MNTHETYVSLETAKLLKQAGFDWECIRYYQNNEETLYGPLVEQFKLVSTDFNVAPIYMDQYSAPTLAVAQRWLREVKGYSVEPGIYITPEYVYLEREPWDSYYCNITVPSTRHSEDLITMFDTYEEALEAGIKKCLTLIIKD